MADFYGTVVGADAYHLARGNTTWTGDNTAKEVALLRGSEYVDTTFRSDFPGEKTGERAQVREWPRSWADDADGNALDPDEIPIEVENATYEAALRELTSPGALQPDYNPAGQQKSVQVDVIKIEYAAPYGADSVLPIITVIRGILAPLLSGSTSSSIAGRAART